MDNDKLVLADGTEITLESSKGIRELCVTVTDKAEACTLWERFTKENLEQVIIKNSEGEITGKYSKMILDHITGKENTDGNVQITFNLRSKTAEELMEERIALLEAGQQTQDEAISDIGQVVSDMAEGGMQ